jgi:translation initiation factor IF-1
LPGRSKRPLLDEYAGGDQCGGDLNAADGRAARRAPRKPQKRGSHLPKNDAVEMDGTVIDALPNSQFTVRLDNGHELLAYTGGRMRRFHIRILLGDRVKVEMSPYDLSRGRVAYRYR